jgi:hypothetical protein
MDFSVQGRWSFMSRRRLVRETALGPYGWNSTTPGEVSFDMRQGSGEAFQYLSARNWSNPQNASGTPKIVKNVCLSWTEWRSETVHVLNFGGTFDCSENWWIHISFACCDRRRISILISLPIHSMLSKILRGSTDKNQDNNCDQKSYDNRIFRRNESLGPRYSS